MQPAYQNDYQNYDCQMPFLPAYPGQYFNSQQTEYLDSMNKGVDEIVNNSEYFAIHTF